MTDKELLKALENLDVDENEFDNLDVELNDLEKKRIRKTYRKNIKTHKYKLKKVAIIAGLSLFVGTSLFYTSKVKANDIPILSNIYEMLGGYDEYISYSKYIGDSIEVKGGKYTLEEILITPYKSLIAIRITGDKPIKENDTNFSISSSIGNSYLESSYSSIYKIDDHNIIQVIEGKYSSKIPKKSPVNININELGDSETPLDFGEGNFNIKVDFGKSYSEFDYLPIKNGRLKGYGIKLKELNSSILGSEILGDIFTFKDSEDYIDSAMNLSFILSVDGKMYGGVSSLSLSSLGNIISYGEFSTSFNGLKTSNFDHIQNIGLSVFKPKYSQKDISEIYESEKGKKLIEFNESSTNKVSTNGVSYYETLKLFNDRKIEFYNLERKNKTLKLHAKLSDSSDINLLTNIIATTNEGKVLYYPEVYLNSNSENEYIIEFSNISDDLNVSISNHGIFSNQYDFLQEIKIK